MSVPEFEYLVMTQWGEHVAMFVRAEMALFLCARLGEGSTIHANGQLLWTHDAAAWDEAHATPDGGIKLLTSTARIIETRQLDYWRTPEMLRTLHRLMQSAPTGAGS